MRLRFWCGADLPQSLLYQTHYILYMNGGHASCHLGLPAHLLPWAMLSAPCGPFCLKRSLKPQLGVCATKHEVVLFFLHSFIVLAPKSKPTNNKKHLAKYPCSSPTVNQTSTFSPNGSWSSNWMLCYHDLFFYWMQVKVQTEKKFGPPATNLLNSHCRIVFSMPLDELLGLPQIFIQLHFDNNELQ